MQYYELKTIDNKPVKHILRDKDAVEFYVNECYPDWQTAEVLHYLRAGNMIEDVMYQLRKDDNMVIWLTE
jgi:hypothetical protein